MHALLNNELFVLTLVIGTYLMSLWIYRKTGLAFLHPVPLCIGVLILILTFTHTDYSTFTKGSRMIDFMLGPAVVALGLILYEQYEHVKKNFVPILITVFTGALSGIISVGGIAWLFGADKVIIETLLPKSVTTPIAIGISQRFGGLPGLTAVIVVLVGVFGGIIGPYILRKLKVTSSVARGLAMGSGAHGLGMTRALELGAVEGALGGLAIVLMGLMTAILIPIVNFVIDLF
ncbi:MAG: LrgB family protein [Bacteroidota bacterium]|nr:LrgB family protein [Bacteroidota bacterium]